MTTFQVCWALFDFRRLRMRSPTWKIERLLLVCMSCAQNDHTVRTDPAEPPLMSKCSECTLVMTLSRKLTLFTMSSHGSHALTETQRNSFLWREAGCSGSSGGPETPQLIFRTIKLPPLSLSLPVAGCCSLLNKISFKKAGSIYFSQKA